MAAVSSAISCVVAPCVVSANGRQTYWPLKGSQNARGRPVFLTGAGVRGGEDGIGGGGGGGVGGGGGGGSCDMVN